MSCVQFVTFDFIEKEKRYVMKFTEQGKKPINLKNSSKLIYRNELNNISFPKFTAMDFNIFFTILFYVSKCIRKNGGIREMIKKSDNETDEFIEIKFNDLKVFMPQIKNKKRFFNEIVNFVLSKLKYVGADKINYNKLEDLNNGVSGKICGASFFKDYEVNADEELLKLKLTPLAYSILGEFGNFMSFNMNEFCSFTNKYTKTLFRLLKQYENLSSKQVFMNKTEFLKFVDLSSKDNLARPVNIENKIIIPSVKELNSKSISFENVDYEKVYEQDEEIKNIIKRRKIKGFKFVFERRQ